MNRIIKSTFFAFILLFIMTGSKQSAYADELNYVRVGIGSPVSSIAVTGNNIDVFFRLDGNFINVGSIYSANSFNLSADDYYYAATNKVYGSHNDALNEAGRYYAQGRNAIPALSENGVWSVFIGPFYSKTEAEQALQANAGESVVEPGGKRLALSAGATKIALFENNMFIPYFSNAGTNTVTVGSSEYRGYLNAYRSNLSVIPVNFLPMEEYLYSSVASEMPSSWHIEALKAQAVASRCYAYSKLGAHESSGYDLCSSDHCQIYLGVKQEKEGATNAVNATNSLVAYYGEDLINATFFSSSGGYTDDSENVWVNAMPYLRSVSDSYDSTGKEWTRSFTLSELTNLASLNNYSLGSVTGVEISKTSSNGRVQELIIKGTSGNKILTKEEIRTFFSKATGGSLESRYFRIGQFSVSVSDGISASISPTVENIASNLYVKSDNSSARSEANVIRVINGSGNNVSTTYYNSVNLQSSVGKYELPISISSPIPNNAVITGGTTVVSGGLVSSGNTVTFSGRGWGHGVGLSQHGAKGMAEYGFTFDQILKHYYTGIELLKVK